MKLLDLGIAKMREIAGESTGTTELTMAGQVLGTPYYMSPEQWGEPRVTEIRRSMGAQISTVWVWSPTR